MDITLYTNDHAKFILSSFFAYGGALSVDIADKHVCLVCGDCEFCGIDSLSATLPECVQVVLNACNTLLATCLIYSDNYDTLNKRLVGIGDRIAANYPELYL